MKIQVSPLLFETGFFWFFFSFEHACLKCRNSFVQKDSAALLAKQTNDYSGNCTKWEYQLAKLDYFRNKQGCNRYFLIYPFPLLYPFMFVLDILHFNLFYISCPIYLQSIPLWIFLLNFQISIGNFILKAFVEVGSSCWDALLLYYSFFILVPTLGHSNWWHGAMNAATKSSLICKWHFSGKRPFQQKTLFISSEGKKKRRKQQQKLKNQPWKWCKFEKFIKLQVYVLCSVVTLLNSKETGDSTGRHTYQVLILAMGKVWRAFS